MSRKKRPRQSTRAKSSVSDARSRPPSTENSEENSGIPGPHGGRLHPWKPGVSGNPGGRPKKPITDAYLRKLTTAQTEAVAESLIRKARRGNILAIKEITDRVEGKAAMAEEDREAMGDPVTTEERSELLDQMLSRMLSRGITGGRLPRTAEILSRMMVESQERAGMARREPPKLGPGTPEDVAHQPSAPQTGNGNRVPRDIRGAKANGSDDPRTKK